MKLAVKHPRKGHVFVTEDVPGADCLVRCDYVDGGWWVYDVRTMTDAQIIALTGKPPKTWRRSTRKECGK